ncbi:MAG: response regulator transcription factor [Deltaproteobacteria bacterium]|nr:response regulator transcription factor [Deltaproteobacteria bacterium]
MRILLVEDEKELSNIIKKGLEEASYNVDVAYDGEEAFYMAANYPVDVVILDVMLPKMDGIAVLKKLRAAKSEVPVILLTALDSVADKIKGLDAGADDYLPKPFEFGELLARVRALLRRKSSAKQSVIRIADLEIDTAARIVRRGGEEIALSAKEYSILELMAYNKDRVVSRQAISERIYEEDVERDSNVVDVFINYLRKKIDKDREVKLIQTVRGSGYMLRSQEE